MIVDQASRLAVKRQLAHRIGEARARNGEAVLFRLGRPIRVGGQEHLEGRPVRDLGVELARRAETQPHLVVRLGFEGRSDLLGRFGEVGRHGDLDVGGECRAANGQHQTGGRPAQSLSCVAMSHKSLPREGVM